MIHPIRLPHSQHYGTGKVFVVNLLLIGFWWRVLMGLILQGLSRLLHPLLGLSGLIFELPILPFFA